MTLNRIYFGDSDHQKLIPNPTHTVDVMGGFSSLGAEFELMKLDDTKTLFIHLCYPIKNTFQVTP